MTTKSLKSFWLYVVIRLHLSRRELMLYRELLPRIRTRSSFRASVSTTTTSLRCTRKEAWYSEM